MRKTKKLRKAMNNWIEKNGACDLEIKEENIQLFNGGLFQDCNENYAELWVGDLDSTIRYLVNLKYFLNKHGFNTRRSSHDYILDKRNVKQKNDEVENGS